MEEKRGRRCCLPRPGLALWAKPWMHNDIDGLRFSMESQFYVLFDPGLRTLIECYVNGLPVKIYANALQRPFPLRIWFRRSQTST